MYTIRCPEEREHSASNSDVIYPTCGHLLAVIENGVMYLRCPICKFFWELNIIDGTNVEMRKVDKKLNLRLTSNLRAVI
jgi:phage FluMu protein Com